MIKAILIDDEFKLRQVLRIKLEKLFPEMEIVAEASNVTEGLNQITKHQPDLIFLDIAMPDGTGFDLLERLVSIPFEVILVTGYNEYALKAIKASAVDYLLKPVKTEDLKNAVLKAIKRIEGKKKAEQFDFISQQQLQQELQTTMVALPGCQDFSHIIVHRILYCEGWQKYTKIYLEDGSHLVSSYNIGVFEELLGDYGFFRSHKSFLVNIQHITSIQANSKVELIKGSQVPVSRRRHDSLKERLTRLQSITTRNENP